MNNLIGTAAHNEITIVSFSRGRLVISTLQMWQLSVAWYACPAEIRALVQRYIHTEVAAPKVPESTEPVVLSSYIVVTLSCPVSPTVKMHSSLLNLWELAQEKLVRNQHFLPFVVFRRTFSFRKQSKTCEQKFTKNTNFERHTIKNNIKVEQNEKKTPKSS